MSHTRPSLQDHAHRPVLDRRSSGRFPIREDIRYRTIGSREPAPAGGGETLDMSSGGIRFTAGEELRPGRLLEVAVNWPVRLDGTCPLQFVATGHVVRTEGKRAVVSIDRYEFKTRRRDT